MMCWLFLNAIGQRERPSSTGSPALFVAWSRRFVSIVGTASVPQCCVARRVETWLDGCLVIGF
jgi:hypothetical protein